jgi:hypothetical protein
MVLDIWQWVAMLVLAGAIVVGANGGGRREPR